jgi:hypothetical protein
MTEDAKRHVVEVAVPFSYGPWTKQALTWDSRDMAQLSALLDPSLKGKTWRVAPVPANTPSKDFTSPA